VTATAHLLAGVHRAAVTREPFAHLARGGAVDPGVYEALSASFPPLESFLAPREVGGSNRAVRRNAVRVAADPGTPPVWREFFAHHTSADYWRDVVRLFAGHFRRAFPDLEARIGRPYEQWRIAPRGADPDADVRLDCQFVVNTPVTVRSSVKTAHVDKGDKIFSALFYVPDPRETGAGGDLELYAWRRAPRFVKHRVLARDVAVVRTVPYAANTCVAFVNSPRSVHGVTPRDATDVPRRYVNLIAEVRVRAFRPQQVGRVVRRWYGVATGGEDDA